LAAAAASALLPGAAGMYSMTVGPVTNLNYIGSELNVTRGEQFAYQAQSFWTDWTSAIGIGVKVLSLAVTAGAMAADIAGSVMSATNNSGGVEWAAICSRIYVQRLMGLLRSLEEHNAIAQAAVAKAAEAVDMTEEITKLVASADANAMKLSEAIVDACSKKAGTTIDLVQRGLALLGGQVDLLEQDLGRTDRVYTSDYSLTAKDITFLSTAENQPPENQMAATTINITAKGGTNNGTVRIQGSQQATMSAANGSVSVGVQRSADDPLSGNLSLTNTLMGAITLTQGIGPASPTIQLQANPAPPSIAMTVGLPDAGAALNMGLTGITLSLGPPGAGCALAMKPDGLTLSFAAWSLTMNSVGITLTVGSNTIKVAPGSLELNGLLIKLVAQLETEAQAVSWKLSASALQQVQAALTKEG
jgi:hypothetical protein